MKKLIVFLLIGVLLLTSCAKKSESMNDMATMEGAYVESSVAAPEMAPQVAYDGKMKAEESGQFNQPGAVGALPINQQKIITVSFEMETLNFEDTVQKINKSVLDHKGYTQNSQMTGNNREPEQKNRFAYFEVRIPSELVENFMKEIRTSGVVIGEYVQSEDVTAILIDNDARLKSLTIQEDSLLAIMAKATKLEDIILLESRLAEIRYQIESIESTQRSLKNQVAFSTVKINLNEVYEITEVKVVPVTFGQKFVDAFKSATNNFIEFFQSLTLGIVGNLFFILLWSGILIIAFKVLKAKTKKIPTTVVKKDVNEKDEHK